MVIYSVFNMLEIKYSENLSKIQNLPQPHDPNNTVFTVFFFFKAVIVL